MGAIYPDFSLGTWVERFNTGYSATLIGYTHLPIPPVSITNYTFTEAYIRVLITSDTAKTKWVQGCWLQQTIPTFLGNNDLVNLYYAKLGVAEIFNVVQCADGYNLKINFYPWFTDVNIGIWAWQG